MRHCLKCKYAKWDRTKTGRLHPSGEGICTYPYKIPQLPASMYWVSGEPPIPCTAFIHRKKELDNHCPYWQEK